MVQKLTESKFGIAKFGIPIEIRSLISARIGCSLHDFSSTTQVEKFNDRRNEVTGLLEVVN